MMNEPMFDAPIPGQSLTTEPGNRPWERPPQYPTLDDAVGYYMKAFENPKFPIAMLEQADNGVPLTALVDIMTEASVMEGKHTVDVSILVAPILIEALITLAENMGYDYTVGIEDAEEEAGMSDAARRKAVAEVYAQEAEEMGIEVPAEDIEESVKEASEVKPTGLMARRGDK